MSRVYYPQARAILQVVFDGFGETSRDTAPQIIPVLPKSVTIHRNSYRQADSFDMTFSADDLPIDPQQVRAAAVEIFLFQVQGMDDDKRLVSRQQTLLEQNIKGADPTSGMEAVALENNLSVSRNKFTLDNPPQIAGLVDDLDVEYGSGGRWVTLSGQDYTSYLAGRQWPPLPNGHRRRIPVGRRLDVLLKEILAEADPTGRLAIQVENIEPSSLPIVGAKESRVHKRGIPIDQQTSFWDVMYKTATRYGCILFVRGLSVILTRPQNLNNIHDPRIRRLAWGRDLESLQMNRTLGKEKVPRVVVKSYDETTRSTITVEYPAKKESIPQGTLGVSEDEFQIVPVYGITDRAVLKDMAENLFNLVGRAERKVRLTTMDLKDLQEKDLLNLAAGDAVTVDFEEFNLNRALLANPDVSTQAKFQYLVGRGYNPAVAQVIASNYQKLELLKRPMRVREISYSYDVQSGVSIEAELVDFVVLDGVRNPSNKVPRKEKRDRKLAKADGGTIGG